jgi:hypothetical protein
MRRYDDSRGWDRARDRGHRGPNYEPEPSVFAWIPSAGIDYDVIYEDLPLYLGAGSTVERANHPQVS